VVSISGYKDVERNSESALKAAVANQPVSVAIEADQQSFQFYKSGVFAGECGTNLDHGVLVVGYGTDGSDDYWIIKNSWGSSWGDNGFIRIARNVAASEGQCGVAMQPSYPVQDNAMLADTKVGSTINVKDCSSSSAHVKNLKWDISPSSPKKGDTVTLTGSGDLDEGVTAGTYTLTAKFDGIKVLDHTHSVCGSDTIALPMGLGNINVNGLTCPEAKGTVSLKESIPIPASAPSGTITANFKATDSDGNELLCLEVDVSL